MKTISARLLKRKWTPRSKRRMVHGSILFISGGLFTLVIALLQPFYTFNLWFSDQFLSSGNPTANVVIAGIDDKTLDTYGKWSEWPRSLHTMAVANLAAAGATVIGFDIIFTDSSPDDDNLSKAMEEAGNVVLATAGTERLRTEKEVVIYDDFLLPSDKLGSACNSIGHVNIVPDPDGKVRSIPLIVENNDGKIYPSLGIATLYTLFHSPLPGNYPVINNKLNLLMRNIPVNSYFMRLNYAVEESSLAYVSYGTIINNDFDPALVKNKIVLIGMTATGDIDTWSIPNSAVRLPGIYLHAAAVDTILRTQFLTDASFPSTLLLMMLMVLICAICLPLFGTWRRIDIIKGTGFILLLLLVYIFTCSFTAGNGYIMNVLYPSLLLITLYITHTVFMVIQEQSDKRLVKDLFGRYVSPQISREIVNMANYGGLKLGGELREVTVLFADIRNFTTISEQMTPEGVVQMLNTCLPLVIDAIVNNGGIVNKFAGDNIMGVWNAPYTQPDHPKLAIQAALEAQSKLMKMGETNPEMREIRFGIGINTGMALAGNVGSLGRVEYTVIGDEVNLASRICSSTPGGHINIGPETYRVTSSFFTTNALEPQVFKGKTKPVPIYQVTGPISPV